MNWHIGHIFALVVLFFISFIAIRDMQVVLMTIEVAGFNPAEYDRPTGFFAVRAIFITLLTTLVGYKTRKTNAVIGNLLLGLGIFFCLFAIAMYVSPRNINILYWCGVWRIYCAVGVVLSIAAMGNVNKTEAPVSKYEDDILDDIL